MLKKLYYIFLETRPKQQYKNLLVFIPLIFSKNLFDIQKLIETIRIFVSFYFISSSLYIINDLYDFNNDILHPKKRNRPIAKGLLNKKEAIIYSIIFFLLSILISNNVLLSILLILYLLNGIFYTIIFKKIVLLDLISLGFSFLIRVITPVYYLGLSFSWWLIIIIFLLSIYLASLKKYLSKKEDREFYKLLSISIYSSILVLWFLYLYSKNYKFLLLTIPIVFYLLSKIFYYVLKINQDVIDFSSEIVYKKDIIIGIILFFVFIIYFFYF